MTQVIDQKILELYQQSNNFGKYLGIELTVLSKGKVRYELEIGEKHLAVPGAAHGGVVAALIDGTLGVAALTMVSHEQKVVSTVELKINFLKPVSPGDILIAEAEVLSAGRRLIYAETGVQNQNGVLIARASGTFNSYPMNKVFPDFKSGT
ncbi:MAG: PaaI family thioesterase [Brumimicrobium sp.]|nr:PaaI family thioesterase [Brumimicrobium sp.]